MPKKADKITDFKSGIDTLTQLVDEMEKGSLTLEELSLIHI